MTGPRPFALDDGDGIVLGQASSTLGSDHDCNAWTRTLTTGTNGQEGMEGLYYLALLTRASAAFANVRERDIGRPEGMYFLSPRSPHSAPGFDANSQRTVMNMRARVF